MNFVATKFSIALIIGLLFARLVNAQETTSIAELRILIEEFCENEIDTSVFTSPLKEAIEQFEDQAKALFTQAGTLQNVSYEGTENGIDVYLVYFSSGMKMVWQISRQADGKIRFLTFGPI